MFRNKEHMCIHARKSGKLKLGTGQKEHWIMFQLKGKIGYGQTGV